MAKTITKSYYGSTCILKDKCPKCKDVSFIIDGLFQCCLTPATLNYKKQKSKRESLGALKRKRIPLKLRKKILLEQSNRCIYCEHVLFGKRWSKSKKKYVAIRRHFDHFNSWNYSQDSRSSNIVAACDLCNGIKSDKFFYDFISAREYILEERLRKGYNKVKEQL